MAGSEAEEVKGLNFILWKMQSYQKVLRQVVVRFATSTVSATSWRMGLPETVKGTGVLSRRGGRGEMLEEVRRTVSSLGCARRGGRRS